MNYFNMSKVELHVHLDTCLSYFYLKEFYPELTLEKFEEMFVAISPCKNLSEFLAKLAPQIDILQSRHALEMAVEDLFEQFANDKVIYAEIRFCPLLHIKQGLNAKEVVEIVASKMHQCIRIYNIDANLILCTLRHFDERQSLQVAKLVEQFLGSGVVALDLAGDEAGYSLDAHITAFDYVRSCGGGLIAHAGEACGAENVNEVLNKLKVSRVGHGVRSIESMAMLDRLINENIFLEVCPSCNVICGVTHDLESHPVDSLYHAGVRLNLNTDARTVAATNLSNEYYKVSKVFGWDAEIFDQTNLWAIEASFADRNIKERLIGLINHI